MHLLHIDCTVIDQGFIANCFVDCYFKTPVLIFIFMFMAVLVFVVIFIFIIILVFVFLFINSNTFLNPVII